jgi:hypothetical protein
VWNWEDWNYFLGEWTGEGEGAPGQGSGGFRFDFDLQGQILLRRNFAEYPATAEKPAYRHDDLMIIYRDPAQGFRAMYWDNEGHIIFYAAEFSQDKNKLTLLGDIMPSAPRFRFTYQKVNDDVMGIKFEIAPPGKPEDFSPYIEATARRKTHIK